MTTEIEKTYFSKCEIDHCNTAWARIIVSDKTRDALKSLEAKYDQSTNMHIRKLQGFISRLADGDIFYYFNEDKASVVERRTAYDCLEFPQVPFQLIHNTKFHHYSMLNIRFQYMSYGYDGIEQWVGEGDVNKRVCRFCGKSHPDVTFANVAHAIQEALGNKLLYCYEECDVCNQSLAPIEDNFRKMMDFRRAMYHIPRKGTTAAPKVVGKSFIINPDSNGLPELYIMEESIPKGTDRTKPFIMHFELKDSMINEEMYKALCKMVIDMLPSIELLHFENCIKWILSNEIWTTDSLPSILLAELPTDTVEYPQPVLDIFINNRGNMPKSPYCTAILWIYDIAYMYVMPFVDVDAGKYKYDKDLYIHWSEMRDLIGINLGNLQDSSNFRPSTPWVNWSVDLSLPNIHVLPKSNTIFEECFITKKKCCGIINMPPFLKDGIVFNKARMIKFESLYDGTITENELIDLTQHIEGPSFIIDLIHCQVSVLMRVDVNDTTDKVPYFNFSYDAVFDVPSFSTYVKIETKYGSLTDFSFHYDLRNFLYEESLRAVEPLMIKQRIGTPFEKCSLEKMIECERVLTNAIYIVLLGNDGHFVCVRDTDIHRVGYKESVGY